MRRLTMARRGLAGAVAAVIASVALAMGSASVATAAPVDGGTISGRMVTASGDTVPGIVQARLADGTGGYRSAAVQQDGSYELPVPAGSYLVQFVPESDYVTEAAPYGFARAWFPNAQTPADAQTVVVNPNSDTLFVDSALVAAGRVSGTVAGPDPEYWILFSTGGTPPVDPGVDAQLAYAGGDKSWDYRIAPGTYFPVVYAADPETHDATYPLAVLGRIEVTSGGLVSGVDATLQQSGSLDAYIQLPDGSPYANVDVWIGTQQGSGRLGREVTTDSSGHAVFTHLQPGIWDMSVLSDLDTPYAPLFVRGLVVAGGLASDITSAVGDPLPPGATATPSTRTADGVLLVDRGPLTLTVPDAIDLEGVSYIVSDDTEGPAPLTGDFTQDASGAWTATIDLSGTVGKTSIGLTQEFDLGLTAQTIMPVAIPLAVAETDLIAANRGDVQTPSTATAGTTTTISGLSAGGWYYAWWFSSPTAGGWMQADASGTLIAVVPASLAAGDHTVALVSELRQIAGWAPVTVLAAGGGGGGGGGSSSGGGSGSGSVQLAATGSAAYVAGGIALALLVAGAVVVLVRRRATRSEARR
ncbi:hypothetical protein NY547_12030 [Cnuibacter physcomitrellae]|uniref:hypothetical protein n=1 Tax=Cnuibacter physcomitrellae TaxID=1619308 RepID=UPI0021760AF1|nr:hypothetical protein [Cnuibacter physcomitrellae]MCS5497968.1 hypothetical protein [Cnuibacter physcomitrellae]